MRISITSSRWVIVAAMLLTIAATEETHACICLAWTPAEAAIDADVIFTGTAFSTETAGARFRVDQLYKGAVESELSVLDRARVNLPVISDSVRVTSSCAIGFSPGRSYLIYGTIDQDVILTGQCTRTAPLLNAMEDLLWLEQDRRGGLSYDRLGLLLSDAQPIEDPQTRATVGDSLRFAFASAIDTLLPPERLTIHGVGSQANVLVVQIFDDVFAFADQFGTSVDQPGFIEEFDIAPNGRVDFDDFFRFADDFGKEVINREMLLTVW